MKEKSPKELFLQSLDRCAEDDNFIPLFYKRFLASSEEVRKKFKHTDLNLQKQKLLRSLRLAAAATSGESKGLLELTARGETHNRHNLNIKPEFYDLWLSSIIRTARETDKEWNETTEKAWHKMLGYVIRHLIKDY